MAEKSVTTQATATFTAGDAEGGLSIERDTSGRDQEKACAPLYTAVPPGVMRFDGVEDGFAVIKLWDIKSVNPALYISNAESLQRPVSLGLRDETITETVSFNNSNSASLSKGRLAQGVTILAKSTFIGPEPSYSNGAFTATAPTTGALVVQYTARYEAYKIYYGLPEWVNQRIFRDGMNANDISVPPIMVLAYGGGQSAQAQIERRIASTSPPDCKDDDWLTDTFRSTYVKYKIYEEGDMNNDVSPPVPKPNARYSIIKGYVKHYQYCRARTSRTKFHEYPLPQGANISIIEIRTGSI